MRPSTSLTRGFYHYFIYLNNLKTRHEKTKNVTFFNSRAVYRNRPLEVLTRFSITDPLFGSLKDIYLTVASS